MTAKKIRAKKKVSKRKVERPTIYLVGRKLKINSTRVYAKILKEKIFFCTLNGQKILVSTDPNDFYSVSIKKKSKKRKFMHYPYDYIGFLKKEKSEKLIRDIKKVKKRLHDMMDGNDRLL